MKLTLDQFILQTNKLDKILITLVFFFPIFLSISIFAADFSASLMAIIILILIVKKKNVLIFKEIKKEVYFFSVFYLFILISLIFSISLKESFLPSFFYFRFFLFSLGIFYLIKKYDFFKKILLYSICFTFIIVLSDSIFQYFFLKNIFNYPVLMLGEKNILTSFFNDEKKLGSYLVRLLPFLMSLLYYFNFRKIHYLFFAITGIVIFFSSERVALFLFIILSLFYFLIIKKKFQFVLIGFLILSSLFIGNQSFRFQYFHQTFMQLGIIDSEWNEHYNNVIRYYSKEHEDLSYTAFKIFQKNIFTGSGIKTFYSACNNLKNEKKTQFNKKKLSDKEKKITKYNEPSFSSINLSIKKFITLDRNNQLLCSTHPHNTYFQILSDTGIFLFIFVFVFFLYIIKKIINILLKKNINNIDLCFYFLNIGIILNLFPLIPSGNFYNNWLSLILFYPFGLWLYINQKIRIND